MTRVEQRTQKLIEQLGAVADLVEGRTRSEVAEVKRAARALAQLLKRKPASKAGPKAAPAPRRSAAAGAAKTGRKASAASKRSAASKTKDGRSLSEVRRAAAFKAWETKRGKVTKRKAR
ncbi:MAG TPA: hypothetical protein VIL09_02075 [Microvirga sp.]|jgi:hypothetical protein